MFLVAGTVSQMHRLARIATAISLPLLRAAALMQSGSWCYQCHDVALPECKAGTCQKVEEETWVDHEAFVKVPGNVDWGGGD